jgi:hypothetical protein
MEAKIDVRCLGKADKRMMSVDVRRGRKPDGDGCHLTSEKCQSRHNERYNAVVNAPAVNAVAGHRLNDRPILPKQSRRLVYVRGVDLDATCPPSTIVRDLKEKGVADRLPITIHRRSFLSHSASP